MHRRFLHFHACATSFPNFVEMVTMDHLELFLAVAEVAFNDCLIYHVLSVRHLLQLSALYHNALPVKILLEFFPNKLALQPTTLVAQGLNLNSGFLLCMRGVP